MKFPNRQLDIYQSGIDRSGARRVKGWKFGNGDTYLENFVPKWFSQDTRNVSLIAPADLIEFSKWWKLYHIKY